jgi:hypothetical protein
MEEIRISVHNSRKMPEIDLIRQKWANSHKDISDLPVNGTSANQSGRQLSEPNWWRFILFLQRLKANIPV